MNSTSSVSSRLHERIDSMGWPPFDRTTGRLLVRVVEAAERIDQAPAGNRYGFLPLNNALDHLREHVEERYGSN